MRTSVYYRPISKTQRSSIEDALNQCLIMIEMERGMPLIRLRMIFSGKLLNPVCQLALANVIVTHYYLQRGNQWNELNHNRANMKATLLLFNHVVSTQQI